ncbi:hypothetical protein [Streptomyces zagrosensis]|uniref:ATP-binding protein n=1 Tax=Streptomyces zagrosensis TaxID=1042984 RepID=A0A7W9Q7N0_9ACTN|nr:hypothetical protein [Streptomyces zagrosensis]MBB5934854.1 hypothetical protein [Streptomyces zagrosensis]
MNTRAGHPAAPVSRALLRLGLVVSAAGATFAAGSGAPAVGAPATAAPVDEIVHGALDTAGDVTGHPQARVVPVPRAAMRQATSAVVGPVKRLPTNPLASTGVDLLSNEVSTQIADFKPVSTAMVTAPLSRGATVGQLPLVGDVLRELPG